MILVLTTTEAANLTEPPTTRYTVEREIRRGNLRAEKTGRMWSIDLEEAQRWARQFQPYAGLRKDTLTGPPGPRPVTAAT